MNDSVKCIFNISDYDYIVIECGYTERLIEKNLDFNTFLKDYEFDNIKFIGNVNCKKTYPKENKDILKHFCTGTLVFKKKDGIDINFGTITSLIYNINNEYDFCNFMNGDNICDVSGYTINLNDKIDDNKVDNYEDHIIKVIHIVIDTESG